MVSFHRHEPHDRVAVAFARAHPFVHRILWEVSGQTDQGPPLLLCRAHLERLVWAQTGGSLAWDGNRRPVGSRGMVIHVGDAKPLRRAFPGGESSNGNGRKR